MADGSIESLTVKIDYLQKQVAMVTEIIQNIARIDERIVNHNDALKRFGRKLDSIETEVSEMRDKVGNNFIISRLVERALWIVFAAVTALYFKGF